MVAAALITAGAFQVGGGLISSFAGRQQAHQTREATERSVESIEQDRVNLAVQTEIQNDLNKDRFRRAANNIRAAAGAGGVQQQSTSLVQAIEQVAIESAREESMLILESQQQDEVLQKQIDVVRAQGRANEKSARAQGVGGLLGGLGGIIGGLF